MSNKTDIQLTAEANGIKNSTVAKSITPVIEGNLFLDIIDSKINFADPVFTFASNPTLRLPPGYTFGKYKDGDTPNWIGLNLMQALLDALVAYINPLFTSLSVTGQANVVEIGTTLSGSKTITWAITNNSGTVLTIDIYDNTAAAVLVANTANDGSQAVTVTTIQLNTDGATQSWKGILHDTNQTQDINSASFVVIAHYKIFCGPIASSLTNSASVRAMSISQFDTGAGSIILNTGTSETLMGVALKPGRTITQVIDLDALGADITSEYVAQSNINVGDAGGTNRSYPIYQMTLGVPYSTSHRHQIFYS